MKINFIGGGNMTQAIINGLINNNFKKNDIHVMEIDPAQRSKLQLMAHPYQLHCS